MEAKEWGGGILAPEVNNIALQSQKSTSSIRLVRLSQFLQEVVAKRKLPPGTYGSRPPKVLMKMDIEGSEVDVLPDILLNGGLGAVNGLQIEFHDRLEVIPERQAASLQLDKILYELSILCTNLQSSGYDFNLISIDDETYGTSDFPLPNCNS